MHTFPFVSDSLSQRRRASSAETPLAPGTNEGPHSGLRVGTPVSVDSSSWRTRWGTSFSPRRGVTVCPPVDHHAVAPAGVAVLVAIAAPRGLPRAAASAAAVSARVRAAVAAPPALIAPVAASAATIIVPAAEAVVAAAVLVWAVVHGVALNCRIAHSFVDITATRPVEHARGHAPEVQKRLLPVSLARSCVRETALLPPRKTGPSSL